MVGTNPFAGASNETLKLLKRVAEKYKRYSVLSDENKKYFTDIYWEQEEVVRNLHKFQEYFKYIIELLDEQEQIYKQEMIEVRAKMGDSNLVTLDWLLTKGKLDKFSIDFKQIFFSSIFIGIVSFFEEMIVSFCTKYFLDFKKSENGIIANSLDFLVQKNIRITKSTQLLFSNIVSIRNDFVHHNGRIHNCKRANLKIYCVEEDKKTSKIILSRRFINGLIIELERLFKGIYKDLSELKERELVDGQ